MKDKKGTRKTRQEERFSRSSHTGMHSSFLKEVIQNCIIIDYFFVLIGFQSNL